MTGHNGAVLRCPIFTASDDEFPCSRPGFMQYGAVTVLERAQDDPAFDNSPAPDRLGGGGAAELRLHPRRVAPLPIPDERRRHGGAGLPERTSRRPQQGLPEGADRQRAV